MKIDYTKLTTTELIDKIETNRFFDLPRMVREAFRRLTLQEPKYKVYTALLTQTGTNAPVATILENTTGLNITYSYVTTGWYNISYNASLDVNKVSILFGHSLRYSEMFINVTGASSSGFNITVEGDNIGGVDGAILKNLIEIRVYN